MNEIKEFITENSQTILIIMGVVMIMLVIINIREINLNEPKPETKLVQEVTVETFSTDKEVEPSCPGMFTGNFLKLS